MSNNFKVKKKQLKSMKHGMGIKSTLNVAYEILGNPIVMFDTSYNMLACTQDIITDDLLWNELTTLGTFSHETVDFFHTENFIKDCAQSDIVTFMKSDKLKYDRINGKIFDKDDIQLANINIIACMTPFDKDSVALVETLCNILSLELQKSEFYQELRKVYKESLFNHLIEGSIQMNHTLKVKIAELYEDLKTNLYLAVVDITQYDCTVTHLAYFRDLFKKIQPEYKYYIHSDYIVIIISTDNSILDVKRDLKKLNEFFIKYKIYAGISGCFEDFFTLQKQYREAINALNYGLRDRKKQQIFEYNNIRVEHFLNSVKNTANITEIYSPVIFLILEYDKENNSSLLRLLHLYLLYGKDSTLTCEEMGITRNKLYYLLKKLKNNFGIDWKDGDMLFNIYISIKIFRILLH